MDYLSVAEARERGGLRLALTAGVPGPWGEAAKAVFHVKKLDYAPVLQEATAPNAELVAWTGKANAPQAIWEDEPARSGWAEIALLAERLAPEPRLLPKGPAERARAFGLSHEICGEMGFGWARRLMIFEATNAQRAGAGDDVKGAARMSFDYGFDPAAAKEASDRVAAILGMLAERLHAQRAAGSPYLIGDALSLPDLHWATFAVMAKPQPPEINPMLEVVRGFYDLERTPLWAAVDPILLEHRDFIYREYLPTPLDF